MCESNEQGQFGALPGNYLGPRAVNAIFGLLIVFFLGGCAPDPILSYDSDTPAQVLIAIRAAGVEDGRARFREIFCERFDAIGAPTDGR